MDKTAAEILEERMKESSSFGEMQLVLPGLWIGPEIAAKDYEALQDNGISHVLITNMASPFFQDRLTYLCLDLEDSADEDIFSQFHTSARFIDEGRRAGGVLVHCSLGVSRSSSIVIAYLMISEGMFYAQALQMTKMARKWVQPNVGFVAQLRRLEAILFDGKDIDGATRFVESCELCHLERRTEWIDSTDPSFVVLFCDQCDLPLCVWREHGMDVDGADMKRMETAFRHHADLILGPSTYIIDRMQRSIPGHLHWHARPVPEHMRQWYSRL